MMLAAVLTVLVILAVLVVAGPFLQGRGGEADEVTGMDVYKDQLTEIDRDLELGMIGEAEAKLARAEIERRLLRAARDATADTQPLSAAWHYRIVTGLAAIVVLGSIGIYAAIGHADRFFAQQARDTAGLPRSDAEQAAGGQTGTDAAQQSSEVETLARRLEERLAENPDDADGWRVLGWTYYNMGEFGRAANAYRRAAELRRDSSVIRALLGEAMVRASGGRVTEEALAVFEETLALNPRDERARFYKGVALEQGGNPQGAIEEWLALYQGAPPDAEWTADLRTRIEALAEAHGIDVGGRMAARQGPSGGGGEEMSTADREAMVRGMVDGLAARLEGAPDDPDGWIMLIRSHMVLNEPEKARAALERAEKALGSAPDKLKQVADAAKTLGLQVSSE